MKHDPRHKLYVGYRGFMVRVPPRLSDKGARRGEKGARANAGVLSDTERRVHHFIVEKMTTATAPITPDRIAAGLGMPESHVGAIVDKLEKLKTFVFRSDGRGIDWAYPFSLQNTGFRMTADSGERFFAA